MIQWLAILGFSVHVSAAFAVATLTNKWAKQVFNATCYGAGLLAWVSLALIAKSHAYDYDRRIIFFVALTEAILMGVAFISCFRLKGSG